MTRTCANTCEASSRTIMVLCTHSCRGAHRHSMNMQTGGGSARAWIPLGPFSRRILSRSHRIGVLNNARTNWWAHIANLCGAYISLGNEHNRGQFVQQISRCENSTRTFSHDNCLPTCRFSARIMHFPHTFDNPTIVQPDAEQNFRRTKLLRCWAAECCMNIMPLRGWMFHEYCAKKLWPECMHSECNRMTLKRLFNWQCEVAKLGDLIFDVTQCDTKLVWFQKWFGSFEWMNEKNWRHSCLNMAIDLLKNCYWCAWTRNTSWTKFPDAIFFASQQCAGFVDFKPA